jgi:hypothetical protein
MDQVYIEYLITYGWLWITILIIVIFSLIYYYLKPTLMSYLIEYRHHKYFPYFNKRDKKIGILFNLDESSIGCDNCYFYENYKCRYCENKEFFHPKSYLYTDIRIIITMLRMIELKEKKEKKFYSNHEFKFELFDNTNSDNYESLKDNRLQPYQLYEDWLCLILKQYETGIEGPFNIEYDNKEKNKIYNYYIKSRNGIIL